MHLVPPHPTLIVNTTRLNHRLSCTRQRPPTKRLYRAAHIVNPALQPIHNQTNTVDQHHPLNTICQQENTFTRHAKFGRPERGRLARTTKIRGRDVGRQPHSKHSTTNTLFTTMVKHIILIHTRNGNYIQFK